VLKRVPQQKSVRSSPEATFNVVEAGESFHASVLLWKPCPAQAGKEALLVCRAAERPGQPGVPQGQARQHPRKVLKRGLRFAVAPEMGCSYGERCVPVRKIRVRVDCILRRFKRFVEAFG
jgi:hypothetical protein